MAIAFLIGRIIVALYYIKSGVDHFRNLNMMAGYAGSKGVPAPKLAVAGSGLLLLIGGVSLGLAFYPVIGVASVALFMIGVTPIMHNFWAATDPQQQTIWLAIHYEDAGAG